MSATGRSATTGYVRDRRDFFATPAWCVRAILAHIPSGDVLDPCAGDGSILATVNYEHPDGRQNGYELDPVRASVARERGLGIETRDALAVEAWRSADVILMNPPFRLAEEFVRRALAEARSNTWVVALLRLNWLAGMKRAKFHRDHPSNVYVLPRRPSFTGKGTDACDYGWFVWRRYSGGQWQILAVGDGK